MLHRLLLRWWQLNVHSLPRRHSSEQPGRLVSVQHLSQWQLCSDRIQRVLHVCSRLLLFCLWLQWMFHVYGRDFFQQYWVLIIRCMSDLRCRQLLTAGLKCVHWLFSRNLFACW